MSPVSAQNSLRTVKNSLFIFSESNKSKRALSALHPHGTVSRGGMFRLRLGPQYEGSSSNRQ